MKTFLIDLKTPKVISGSISLIRGNIVLLKGKTGCGKTTVLYEIIRQLRKKYIYVSQKNMIIDYYTIEENFQLFEIPEERMQQYLTRFNLQMSVDTVVNTLSDGQKQRLILAVALSRQIPYLLLDEPLSHLDLDNKYRVMDILEEYAKQYNCYMIIVNHGNLLDEKANIIYEIEQDQIVCTKQNIKEEQVLNNTNTKFNFGYYIWNRWKKQSSSYLIPLCICLSILTMSLAQTFLAKKQIQKIQEDYCTYVIVKADEKIEQYSSYFDLIEPFYKSKGMYNGKEVEICSFVSDMKEYKPGIQGLFITKRVFDEYHVKIGDLVLYNQRFLEVVGVLDDAFIEPYANTNLVFYTNEQIVSENEYIGKLKDIETYELLFEKVKQEHLDYSIQFTNSFTKMSLDYTIGKMNMVRYLYYIVLIVIMVIYGFYQYATMNKNIRDYVYLQCNSISKIVNMALENIVIGLFVVIVFILEYRIISKINYAYIIILTIHLLVSGYYILSKNKFIELIR